jgi:hypothetical protein
VTLRQAQGELGRSGEATHVDFVAILFVVWGALTALVGASTLALGVGAASLATSASSNRHVAAGFTAAAFITLAIIAILWGVAHVLIGVPLRRHSARARLLAILAGSIDLILLPFGTPLGIYALWVLLNERGKAVFGVRYS